jgi:hypothetical protein
MRTQFVNQFNKFKANFRLHIIDNEGIIRYPEEGENIKIMQEQLVKGFTLFVTKDDYEIKVVSSNDQVPWNSIAQNIEEILTQEASEGEIGGYL